MPIFGSTAKLRAAVVVQVLLLFVLIWNVVPTVMLTLNGFKTNGEIIRTPPSYWPEKPTLEAYRFVLTARNGQTDLWQFYFRNSVLVVGTATVLSTGLGLLAGYALSRFRARWVTVMLLGLVLSQVMPTTSLLVPVFYMLKRVGLYNSHLGLILVYTATTLPFATLLARTNLLVIPREVEEAAWLDGCSRFQTFTHILLPMTRISMATVAMMSLLQLWGEFPFAATLMNNSRLLTVPVALANYVSNVSIPWDRMGAASTLAGLPIMVIFFLAQRAFVKGLTAGAVKE